MTEAEAVEVEHSVEHGVLPTQERMDRLSVKELKELRDCVVEWSGPAVEWFRDRVNDRIVAEGRDEDGS
jgi:hypothetical protein